MSQQQPRLRTFELQHIPQPHAVHVALYRDVANAEDLRQQLLAGNPEFEYAFVNAATIVSTAHALASAHKALYNLLVAEKLRTRNVHSECVFSLSPNNNITESFRRFGITPETKSLLCIKISTPSAPIDASTVSARLSSIVQGTPIKFSDDSFWRDGGVSDWGRVKKCYKLGTVGFGGGAEKGGGKGRQEITVDYVREAELEILGKMVLRIVG